MKVLIKDNRGPVRVIHEFIVTSNENYKWIEFTKASLEPNDVDLSNFILKRMIVDQDYVTLYVVPKENASG